MRRRWYFTGGCGRRPCSFGLCFVEIRAYKLAQRIERSLRIRPTGTNGHRLPLAQTKREETREAGGIAFSSASNYTDVRLEARGGLYNTAGRAKMQTQGVGQCDLRFECRSLACG